MRSKVWESYIKILCYVKPGGLSIPLEGPLRYIISKLEKHVMVDYGRDSPAFLLRDVYMWEYLHECTQTSFSWPFHRHALSTLLCRPSTVHRDTTVDKTIMGIKCRWMRWSISKYRYCEVLISAMKKNKAENRDWECLTGIVPVDRVIREGLSRGRLRVQAWLKWEDRLWDNVGEDASRQNVGDAIIRFSNLE